MVRLPLLIGHFTDASRSYCIRAKASAGHAHPTPDQSRDLLEILDDRQGRGSTIVTSQVDVKHWHEMIANPTVADAILDRLVHSAHRLNLTGDSMRDPKNKTVRRGKLDTDAAA